MIGGGVGPLGGVVVGVMLIKSSIDLDGDSDDVVESE
jgi:hypothetical protein